MTHIHIPTPLCAACRKPLKIDRRDDGWFCKHCGERLPWSPSKTVGVAMSDRVLIAVENLAEALLDAIIETLRKQGFYPSEKFKQELRHLLETHIRLG